LNGRNILFANSVKYLGVFFDKKIKWRLHIETVEAKAFRIFIRLYSLFKSDRLSTNIKFTIYRALVRSVITYSCPAWEFAADTQLKKPQRLQNRVLRTTGRFIRNATITILDSHVALQIPYMYDYMTKLRRRQADVIQNHENSHIRNI
jgi:hypothetical protein